METSNMVIEDGFPSIICTAIAIECSHCSLHVASFSKIAAMGLAFAQYLSFHLLGAEGHVC